jgi:hypothetical protein
MRLRDRIFIIGFGSIFLLIGIAMGWQNFRLVSGGVTAEAEIIDVVERVDTTGDDRGSITYAPTYRFTAADGSVQTVTSSMSTNSLPPIGMKEDIIYDPKNPKKLIKDAFMDIWLFPLVFALVGGAVVLIGAVGKNVRTRDTGGVRMPSPEVAMMDGVPMVPLAPDLVAYVAAARAQGTADTAIRTTLVGSGWKAADVDRALTTRS